jgi:Fe-S cluster biogenesis protein NfuA
VNARATSGGAGLDTNAGAADAADIEEALAELNLALRAHGGSVEFAGMNGSTLRLRPTGLCAACLFKPVTVAATIGPYISERLGMEVELEGARISAEARVRLERASASSLRGGSTPH